MREEPIISGGVLKAALVLLVAGGLGVGAYAIAGGGIDIDLPDLPDIETLGEETTTDLENTTIEETTAVELPEPEASDPFSSAGFAQALTQVKDAVGPNQQLTRLVINEVQTQLIVRRGEESVEAYSVRADSGELAREEATITISGSATLADFAYPLDAVDPGAVDRMLVEAQAQSGTEDFKATVLSLERAIPFGRRAVEWTINAQGGGRNLLYRANANGGRVRSEGGGAAIPPAAVEAQKLNECIQAAGNEPDQIFACLEKFE